MTAELPPPDANGWRPIECAPKNDCIVLTDGGYLFVGFWQGGRGCWMTGFSGETISIHVTLTPTHWQPMLKGPVEVTEAQS